MSQNETDYNYINDKQLENILLEFISIEKQINIILMAGLNVIEKGFNCGKILRDIVSKFGGGGGGKKELGQGGGIKNEDINDLKQFSIDYIKNKIQNI